MSQLELETHTLTLVRYPKTSENSTLQAWEAADAFLLNEISAMELACTWPCGNSERRIRCSGMWFTVTWSDLR